MEHSFYVQLLFHFENRAGYEIMWKNVEEPVRPHDNMAHARYMLDT